MTRGHSRRDDLLPIGSVFLFTGKAILLNKWRAIMAAGLSEQRSLSPRLPFRQSGILMLVRRPILVIASSTVLGLIPPSIKAWATTPSTPSGQNWTIYKGDTFRKDLTAWASAAGWHLNWIPKEDVIVPATVTFSGSFPVAAQEVTAPSLKAAGVFMCSEEYPSKVLDINVIQVDETPQDENMVENVLLCSNGLPSHP